MSDETKATLGTVGVGLGGGFGIAAIVCLGNLIAAVVGGHGWGTIVCVLLWMFFGSIGGLIKEEATDE